MKIRIGIDLGTTNTLVITEQRGKLRNIKFNGQTNLPSVVFYDESKVIVGREAKQKGIIHPENMIKSSKTYMGDFSKVWEINGKKITPTMVAGEILKEVKEKIIKKLKLTDEDEIEAVITVPAYFTSKQKEETEKAAHLAGISVLKIITEPVAAAIAHGLEVGKNEKIFVFDLGGGTFDVAVLEAKPEEDTYETIAVDGDKRLGGDNFDELLRDNFVKKIKEDTGIDFSSFEKSKLAGVQEYLIIMGKLLELAENTKISLSESETVDVEEQYLFTNNDTKEPYHFSMVLTRNDFDKICEPLKKRIETIIFRCLNDNKLTYTDIDRIVLVGGSSNLPFVYKLLEDIFEKSPCSLFDAGNLVVTGAGIIANGYDALGNNKIQVTELISHSLGIELDGGKFAPILKKGDSYPISADDSFTTTVDYQKEVEISVYEGENEDDVTQNEFYNSFTLTDIQKAARGVPEIVVTFSFDKNGILKVSAQDKHTKSKKEVIIKKGVGGPHKKKKTEKLDIALLIDVSGSMGGRRIDEANNACDKLIKELLDFSNHKLSITIFGNSTEIITPLSNDKNYLLNVRKNICLKDKLGYGTNMSAGISVASNTLNKGENKKVLIMITDGCPNSTREAASAAAKAKNVGIDFYAIGVEQADAKFLKTITSSPNKYFNIDNVSKLQETFKTIINSLNRM